MPIFFRAVAKRQFSFLFFLICTFPISRMVFTQTLIDTISYNIDKTPLGNASELTHWGLASGYGDTVLDKHWLKLWLDPCRHQTLICNNWLFINEVLWHSSKGSFTSYAQVINPGYVFEKWQFKTTATLPWGQWVQVSPLHQPISICTYWPASYITVYILNCSLTQNIFVIQSFCHQDDTVSWNPFCIMCCCGYDSSLFDNIVWEACDSNPRQYFTPCGVNLHRCLDRYPWRLIS